MATPCSFPACDGAARSRGLCVSHNSQRRLGIPLRPIKRWNTPTACPVCGEMTGVRKTLRKFCSHSCEAKWYRYGGEVPRSGICDVCGDEITYGPRAGMRSVPVGTRKCPGKHRRQQSYPLTVNEIAVRDGSDCRLCGDPVDLDLKWPHRMAATRDHIVPVTHGGSNSADNLQLAHFSCNSRKGNRIPRAS